MSNTILEILNKNIKSKELVCLLGKIADSTKGISNVVRRAPLSDVFGKHGTKNIQGEEVMKLDIMSNDILINNLRNCKYCCGVASEEDDEVLIFEGKKEGKYVVLFDPLDGSSNIDTNAPVGTIFVVYEVSNIGTAILDDFLQSGDNIIAAGYSNYGSSTQLIIATDDIIKGFTYEVETNSYLESYDKITTPEYKNQYSINLGNHHYFSEDLKRYVSWCSEENKDDLRPYGLRYIGSMVGDFHRVLFKGGLFIYPSTTKSPNGKLRLLYECNPLSYIIEKSGGKSTNGNKRILEITPVELHQRTPIAIGSSKMIDKYIEINK